MDVILTIVCSASVSAGAYIIGFRKGARWVLNQWKEEIYYDKK